MIEQQLMERGIRDRLVLGAMRSVPRQLFVPAALVRDAYADSALPIGHDQTISQPYIVALMTEALLLSGGETVLEIGTGSAYQSAVLAEIVDRVCSLEIIEELAASAVDRLDRLCYRNVEIRVGDGYRGWPERIQFDAAIVTAAPDHVPGALVDQLKIGGRLVIPVGDTDQELIRITRTEEGVRRERILPVRFVPMTGEARQR